MSAEPVQIVVAGQRRAAEREQASTINGYSNQQCLRLHNACGRAPENAPQPMFLWSIGPK